MRPTLSLELCSGSVWRSVGPRGAEHTLLVIGQETFPWLETGGALKDWMAGSTRDLEVLLTSQSPLGDALLATSAEQNG
ncbi:MAG: hypothetical protein AAGI34_14285 [Pseudomonadota bacterium]